MLKFALLVLTLNANGDTQVTISETDDLAECHEQLETVQGLLLGMERQIAHISCGQTKAQLTPFEHGLGPEAYKYHYRVEIGATQFTMTPYEGGTCVADMQADPMTYCAVSSQAMAAE